VIKSGGAWISSVEIEALVAGYVGVAAAAVIGVSVQSGRSDRCW